jgi:hypothetical protein
MINLKNYRDNIEEKNLEFFKINWIKKFYNQLNDFDLIIILTDAIKNNQFDIFNIVLQSNVIKACFSDNLLLREAFSNQVRNTRIICCLFSIKGVKDKLLDKDKELYKEINEFYLKNNIVKF